jgi:hypothetical protein
MHDVLHDKVPDSMKSFFKVKTHTRSSRSDNQVEIPRIKYDIGKETVQYRDPVIWNFLNRIVKLKLNISKDNFKQVLRRLSKDINDFSFKAPMVAKKDNNYVFF